MLSKNHQIDSSVFLASLGPAQKTLTAKAFQVKQDSVGSTVRYEVMKLCTKYI